MPWWSAARNRTPTAARTATVLPHHAPPRPQGEPKGFPETTWPAFSTPPTNNCADPSCGSGTAWAHTAYEFTFNAQQVGQLQGQALVDAMTKAGTPRGAQIVMINGDTSGPEAQKFKEGAHSVIDASGYKDAAEYDTPKWSPDTATSEMSQAITKVGKADEPPWIFRRENQLRSFLFWKERGHGDGETAQVVYA